MSKFTLENYTIRPEKGKVYIPKIELNSNGVFKLIGSSFMENAFQFYEPLFDWMSKFMESKKPIELYVLLDYYNTSSAKSFDRLFRTLKAYKDSGNQVKVVWYYEENDPDLYDDGKDFQSLIDIPFELVSFKKKEYPIAID